MQRHAQHTPTHEGLRPSRTPSLDDSEAASTRGWYEASTHAASGSWGDGFLWGSDAPRSASYVQERESERATNTERERAPRWTAVRRGSELGAKLGLIKVANWRNNSAPYHGIKPYSSSSHHHSFVLVHVPSPSCDVHKRFSCSRNTLCLCVFVLNFWFSIFKFRTGFRVEGNIPSRCLVLCGAPPVRFKTNTESTWQRFSLGPISLGALLLFAVANPAK